jgi:hypothetical protein
MKDIFASVGKLLGIVFAALVIGFTSLLTWKLAQRIIPDDTILQVMTLVLFDGAALVWFITFIAQAQGTTQWALASVGFAVGLLGAVIMAAGELVLGQQLVAVDNPEQLGWILVATVIVAALAHAVLIYLFHFSNPQVKNRIENAQKVSQAIERAYADARGRIDSEVDTLVAGLVESVVDEARQQINASTALHIRSALQAKTKALETLSGAPVVDGGELKTVPLRRVPLRRQTSAGFRHRRPTQENPTSR